MSWFRWVQDDPLALLSLLARGHLTIELYNLAEDMGEQHDVAPRHPALVSRLAAWMEREHERSELFPLIPLDPPARDRR